MTEKAKISFNIVGASPATPRRTTLLIRDADLKLHQSGLSDRPLEVEQGSYYVSMRRPDGDERVLTEIEVPAGGGSHSFDLPAKSLQQITAVLPRAGRKPLADADDAVRSAVSPAIDVVPWQSKWLSHWIEQAAQDRLAVSVPSARQRYTLDVEQILKPPPKEAKDELLLAVDEGRTGNMTFFAVPFDGPIYTSEKHSTLVTIRRRERLSTTRQTECHDLTFAFEDPEVTRFLEYVRDGLLREAYAYSEEAVKAARLELRDKQDSPLGAVIGTYVLLRANALDGLDVATANLMSIAPDLPDVLPLRVEYLARSARHSEAVTMLQRAQEFGCPWFRSGVFYLLGRARRYLSADSTAELRIPRRARAEIAILADGLELLSAYLDPNHTVATYRDVPVAMWGLPADHAVQATRKGPPMHASDSVPPKDPKANGDEDRHFGPQKIRFIGNFHKTLPHNEFGEVVPGSYEEFRAAAADSNAPNAGDFEQVDPGPLTSPHQAAPACAGKQDRADRLVNPQAGRAKESCGPDPRSLNMLPAPEVLSNSTAAEMTELYWMALLRDVSFDLFPQAGQLDTAIGDLKQAFERALADDKADGRLRLGLDLPKGADGKLRLDAQTLFRSGLPGEDRGPLVSQFFLHDVPYGTQTIKQHQFPYRAGRDYLTDHKSWLLAQNAGYDQHCLPYPNANSYFDDEKVFDDPPAGAKPGKDGRKPPAKHRIRNMRDLARFVHKDALHQAYFNAALLLLSWGAEFDPGNPYRNGAYTRQRDFGTLGGPHILTQVSEVASRALKVVWRQKWLVHRRLRPEHYGGLMQMQKLGYNGAKRPYGLPEWVFETQAAQAIHHRANPEGDNTYFLPMAFTSGCPPHPAYGAGHATVAGACVTMLKAWFKEDEPIGALIEKNVHPDTLQKLRMLQPKEMPDDDLPPYAGKDAGAMTAGGELNKIAANVAMGRTMGGVHWRTDNTRSLRLGEQIATVMLKRQSKDYAEKPFRLSYLSFDGNTVKIEDGTVRVEGDPELEAFYAPF